MAYIIIEVSVILTLEQFKSGFTCAGVPDGDVIDIMAIYFSPPGFDSWLVNAIHRIVDLTLSSCMVLSVLRSPDS